MNGLTTQSMLFKSMARFPESPAVTALPGGETLKYRELLDRVEALACHLARLGAGKGTHISVLLPNSIDYILFNLAVIRCGGVITSLNEMLGIREVSYILKDSAPSVVVIGTPGQMPTVADYVKEAEHEVKVLVVKGFGITDPGAFKFFDWDEVSGAFTLPQSAPGDLVRISYTGGTTGTPKGVMHSQYTVVTNLLGHCLERNMDDQSRLLLSSPLQHAAGPVMLSSFLVGAHVYVTRSFDPEYYMATFAREKITVTQMVPTMLYRLLDLGKKKSYDISSIRSIRYGASPVSPQRLKEAFEMFGPVLAQGYGSTECPNLVTRLTPSDHVWAYENDLGVLRSCGKPYMLAEVRLVDDGDGDVAPGQRGEIIVKSPYNMVGYYQQPDLTENTLRNGWLHTGDVGELDQHGFLHIVERKKDMIISGGMNVYSIEVENVVNQHPAVAMSACIGIPHDDWGEAVSVYVVLKEAAACAAEELIGFCKERTAKYMVPKVVNFVTALPLTPTGKIDKKELRKEHWQGKDRDVN